MKINWKVRLHNKTFWLTLVPLLVLLTQQLGLNWVPENGSPDWSDPTVGAET